MSEIPVHPHFNNDTLAAAEVLRARIAWIFLPAIVIAAIDYEPRDAAAVKRPKDVFMDVIETLAVARTGLQIV